MNAEGAVAVRGVRGGRVGLVIGGDGVFVKGERAGTPIRPDVNYLSVRPKGLKERHTRLEYPSLGIKLSPESLSPL